MLFVDDMQERHDHLLSQNAGRYQITYVFSAARAIELLDVQEFDVVSLDHDLQSEHYTRACSADSGCGCDIVDWICLNQERFRDTMFVVHSWNAMAAKRMHIALRDNGLRTIAIPFK